MSPVRRQVDDFRPMYQIIRRINLGGDVDSTLEAVATGVVDAVGFEVASICWLSAEHTLDVVAVAGNDEARTHLLGTRVPLADMERELRVADRWGALLFLPAGRLDDGVGTWVPHCGAAVEPTPEGPGPWDPEDTLRAPLRAPDGQLLGLLSVDLPRDGMRPSEARCALLEMYADLAGLALSNASRARALEDRVRLSSAVQAALVSSAHAVDASRLAEDAVVSIAEALRAPTVWMRVFDPHDPESPGTVACASDAPLPSAPPHVLAHAVADARAAWAAGQLSLASMRGTRWVASASARTESQGRVSVADGRAGWVHRREDALRPVDYESDGVQAFLDHGGFRHVLMAPLGSGADCLGYVVAARTEGPDWSTEEIDGAARIASNLGQGVLTARVRERERVLVQQLESVDRYKSDLVSTVSHEFRTPLTSVMGHLELIEEAIGEAGDDHVRSSFDVVRRNLQRVLSLTDELLMVRRMSEDSDDEGEVVDLHRVAVDALSTLRAQADTKGVALRLTSLSGPVLINGRVDELERVVLNLVDNAIKYTPEGQLVEVSTELTERFVRLIVRDTGIGISPADQEELFTEFFRSTNPDVLALPGTGLGLSIVRRIVQRHGGAIRLTSEPGRGSTFVVRLPLSHLHEV